MPDTTRDPSDSDSLDRDDTRLSDSSVAEAETGDQEEGRTLFGRKKKAEKSKPHSLWVEIPILVVVALVLSVLIQTFLARVYLIPSESMEPTLHGCPGCTGDRILVDKVSYRFSDPRPGDVVVFRGPESWDADFVSSRSDDVVVRGLQELGSWVGLVAPDENDLVKRVIAVGGQTVGGCDAQGRLMVDGKALDEPYLHDNPAIFRNPRNCAFVPVTVPEGNLWMMGDNRNNSKDSRYHVGDEYNGTVPMDNVIGKARLIVLPPSRWGSISSPEIG